MVPPTPSSQVLQNKLRAWYRKKRRDLPWRRTRDPYAIWVSEIMLQQTQVATVIPFYEKFLRRFPTVHQLARAKIETVLAHWAGLGYYRRAKLLHQGARHVVKELGGILPADPDSLQKIPGIGAYTAGAIASIAFEKPVPLVDGNVVRVLSRLRALEGHHRDPALHRRAWELAGELVPRKHPGDFNQALMELGATVCRSGVPDCIACPLKKFCRASASGRPENFPETAPRVPSRALRRHAGLCEKNGEILLIKRKKTRWFQDMWELPHDYCADGEDGLKNLRDFLRKNLGLSLKEPRPLGTFTHTVTHHRITTSAWSGAVGGRLRPSRIIEQARFFPLARLKQLALPNLDRKILAGNFPSPLDRKVLGESKNIR